MRINGDNSTPLRTAENDISVFFYIPKTAETSVTKWFSKALDPRLICPAKNWDQLVMTDPHSPARWRVNGSLSNSSEFAKAFGCKPGDPMVRPREVVPDIW